MNHSYYQYKVGKDWIYFFYRQVVLPWELSWKTSKFLASHGEFRSFCLKEKLSIKSYPTIKELNQAMPAFEGESKNWNGMLWFVRREQKPKDVLHHLRNAFAHGQFRKRQKNRRDCIFIECTFKNSLRAKGYIPLQAIKGLVHASSSTMTNQKNAVT